MTARKKITFLHVLGFVTWLVTGFVSLSGIFCFMFIKHFIPSEKLSWLSYYFSPVFAALLFSALFALRQMRRKSGSPSHSSGFSRDDVFIIFSPIGGYGAWLLFATGPVPFVLHEFDHPATATRMEDVMHISYGARGCGFKAELRGNTLFVPRRVCLHQDEADILNHANQAKIVLYGAESSYGFRFDRYTVAVGKR